MGIGTGLSQVIFLGVAGPHAVDSSKQAILCHFLVT